VIPDKLRTGDTVNLLNLGGVLGRCTSFSPLVGPPFECEVLGQVLSFPTIGSRKGTPANIGFKESTLDHELASNLPPVYAVAGTCMNSGKTEACIAMIQQLVRSGKRVMGAKTTGVSLRRDIHAMEDAGALETMIFTDLGIVTTQAANAPALTRTMMNRLAARNPDVIVLELGDGLMGQYGVDAILADPAIAASLCGIVLAANDPVGAWGGAELLQRTYGLQASVITGPATDNLAGQSAIQSHTSVPAVNARSNAASLLQAILNPEVLTHAR
jgi:hypothetical protein